MKDLVRAKCSISTRGDIGPDTTSIVILDPHRFLLKEIRQIVYHEDGDKPLLTSFLILLIYLRDFLV